MRKLVVAAMLLLAMSVAGPSGCTPGNHSAPPAGVRSGAGNVTVAIRSHRFDPRSVAIRAGQTVNWTNYDNTSHVVSGTGFNGELAPGTSYSHKFDSPGTYEYICTLHPDMVGIVVVR